jgi:prepilin-type N-terminal cleavage/methylation domain-containing protein
MKKIKNNKAIFIGRQGFTLLEVLLYVSIFGILILSISGFFSLIINSRSKGQVIMEVQNQGGYLVNFITQKIRNAEGVNSPTIGSNNTSLSLDVVDISDDPTIFNISGDVLYVAEGAGSPVNLTNSRVLISSVNFNNVSLANSPGLISFQFTLSHINPEGRQEYEYSKTFYGSASLR